MAHPTAVINVVGLSRSLIGTDAPNLLRFAGAGSIARLEPVLPAVTCSVQSTMLTGLPPREHGIVGNGWYDRALAEVHFWKQSNRLVGGEKVWETARKRDPSVTCANMFWWFNMHSSADVAVTPRPMYPADGRKIPDIYTEPADLRDRLQADLGRFPLFNFWGPASSIRSSRWIADASKLVWDHHRPTLMLVYLPHLDYGLQKLGPGHPGIREHVSDIDRVVGDLLDFFEERGVQVIILSEYGIEAVEAAVPVNRVLREHGLIRIREERGRELLDPGGSRAFAVADHQVAHVYVRDEADRPEVRDLLARTPGVDRVLDRAGQAQAGLDHARAGDLVLVAAPGRWFSYRYWQNDAIAPDFARTVDIHRKPGYDPLELFIDPGLRWPRLRIAGALLRKRLGFRTLMEVVPLDERLVRGSHGRIGGSPDEQPVVMTGPGRGIGGEALRCAAMRDVILAHLFGD
ncbi:MAG: alkaline phosphatase family protein [Planctomycetota bacterium]|jgi:predicted AlkP superfamily pyrophosphatase or phosphodiesterase